MNSVTEKSLEVLQRQIEDPNIKVLIRSASGQEVCVDGCKVFIHTSFVDSTVKYIHLEGGRNNVKLVFNLVEFERDCDIVVRGANKGFLEARIAQIDSEIIKLQKERNKTSELIGEMK